MQFIYSVLVNALEAAVFVLGAAGMVYAISTGL